MKDLFGNLHTEKISTQGIKYAGAKTKLIKPIIDMAESVSPQTVFDGFSGTTRVSQAFAKKGLKVISNDRAIWSEVFAKCYLCSKNPKNSYQPLIDHLNNVPPVEGWFSSNYGGKPSESNCSIGSDGYKKPFQFQNTMKLDSIRKEIDKIGLSDDEKCVALTSLILALEKVDSTLGHYVSYLKDWSPRSYKKINLEVPDLEVYDKSHEVLCDDTLQIASSIDADIAYYDPPYGSNNEKMPPSRVRYSSYYHIWKTVILDDEPELFGAARRRKDSSDKIDSSVFEDFRKGDSNRFRVVEAIEELIQKTNTKYIILSYSSGGRATAKELNEVLGDNGDIIKVSEIGHNKNVMSHMRWTNEWIKKEDTANVEFLFLLRRKK